eukprot:scaffold113765_cov27-Tisochrysis_lutea.AAC.1
MRKDAANFRAACSRAAHEAHLSALGRKKASAAGSDLEARTSSSGRLTWGGVTCSPANSSQQTPQSLRPSLYHTNLRRTRVGASRNRGIVMGSSVGQKEKTAQEARRQHQRRKAVATHHALHLLLSLHA